MNANDFVPYNGAYSGPQVDAAISRALSGGALDQAIAALRAAVGSPLVAATKAAMTDTSKIYVYTGSEAGYVAGDWYYWDGAAWADGGVYNSVAFTTDKTLTISGAAADAKTVGDKGMVTKPQITANDDLDNYVAVSGMYYSSATVTPTLSHAPWDSGVFCLFVKCASSTAAVSGQAQFAISTFGFASRRRLTGEWSSWYYSADASALDALNAASFIQRGTIPNTDDINNAGYTTSGQYYVSTSHPTNWPFNDSAAGRLLVFGNDSESFSVRVQLAFNMKSKFAWRVSRTSGEGNWGEWHTTEFVDPTLEGAVMIGVGGSWIKQASGSPTALSDQWFSLIANKYGLTAYNEGVAGMSLSPALWDGAAWTTVSSSVYGTIDDTLANYNICNYFIIQGGGNDSTHGAPIYSADAPAGVVSMEAAMEAIVGKVRAKFPRCRILAITCFHRWNNDRSNLSAFPDTHDEDYASGLVNICKKLGVPVFDGWHESGIMPKYNAADPADANTYWPYNASNNKHLNVDGNAWLAPIIAKRLLML